MQLDTYLKKFRITGTEFADKIGVAPSTISRIRTGKNPPGGRTANSIYQATAGHVTPNDFLSGDTPAAMETTADEENARLYWVRHLPKVGARFTARATEIRDWHDRTAELRKEITELEATIRRETPALVSAIRGLWTEEEIRLAKLNSIAGD